MWKSITLDCDLSFQANQTKQLLLFQIYCSSDLSRNAWWANSWMITWLHTNQEAAFQLSFVQVKQEAMFGKLTECFWSSRESVSLPQKYFLPDALLWHHLQVCSEKVGSVLVLYYSIGATLQNGSCIWLNALEEQFQVPGFWWGVFSMSITTNYKDKLLAPSYCTSNWYQQSVEHSVKILLLWLLSMVTIGTTSQLVPAHSNLHLKLWCICEWGQVLAGNVDSLFTETWLSLQTEVKERDLCKVLWHSPILLVCQIYQCHFTDITDLKRHFQVTLPYKSSITS